MSVNAAPRAHTNGPATDAPAFGGFPCAAVPHACSLSALEERFAGEPVGRLTVPARARVYHAAGSGGFFMQFGWEAALSLLPASSTMPAARRRPETRRWRRDFPRKRAFDRPAAFRPYRGRETGRRKRSSAPPNVWNRHTVHRPCRKGDAAADGGVLCHGRGNREGLRGRAETEYTMLYGMGR